MVRPVVGYWHQRADERHGNPSQGNQELLVVKDKVGKSPDELGVSKSTECDIFPSVLSQCWLRDRKCIWPVKTGCWFVGDLTGALHDL